MNIEDIKDKLTLTFSTPFREYYKRHLVFWDDPEKEFIDDIDSLTLDGVTIFKLTNKNWFAAKQLVNDDSTGNVLIYDSTNTDEHDNWLMDARLYADEILHFDFYSMIMSKLGITVESTQMRNAIKSYEKFWKNEERIEKLHKIAPVINFTNDLHLAILATLCGCQSKDISEILFNIFSNSLDVTTNKYVKAVESFGSLAILWKLVNKYAGDCHENLSTAFETIIYTALYQTMGSAMPSKIRTFVFDQSLNDCYTLVSEWTSNIKFSSEIFKMIEDLDEKRGLFTLFDAETIDELVNSDLFSSINDALLRKLFSACATKAISGEKIKSIVEERRKHLFYEKYANYYECLFSIGELYQLYDEISGGFHYINENELWKDYQNRLYLFDTYYRHIHNYVYKSSLNTIDRIQDKLNDALVYVENLYKNYFLKGLNDTWVKLVKDSLANTGKIKFDIKTQLDFYNSYVDTASDDRLTIVIISDGMRYEVAKELENRLGSELKCNVKLEAIQSVFPAITKYGMAALLPGKKTIDNDMNILSNGMKTNSLEARKAVLQSVMPESDAISYVDLFQMNSSEKKEFLKGKEVIYVYHNDIDNAGHDSAGESKVFTSCEETINKLVNIVKALCNARGSIKVLVTSDHGFLYSYDKLEEVDKLSINSDAIVDAKGEKRCIVAKSPIDTDFLTPIKLLINNNENSLIGYAPFQGIRIKNPGGSGNYVHGGISLQEMMVPVIVYENVRTDSKAYGQNKDKYSRVPATIELVTPTREVYGLSLKLEFYQPKPLDSNIVEAKYEILLEDKNGKAISDSQFIIANKADSEPTNRKFKPIILSINSATKTDTYYLIVMNQDTHETIMKEEFKINNDFGGIDFDF